MTGAALGSANLTLTRSPQTGLLTGTTLGSITDSYGYSGFGEVTSYTASVSGNAIFSVTYTRDSLGRIDSKTETIQGVTDAYVYTYDPAGRLTDVTNRGRLGTLGRVCRLELGQVGPTSPIFRSTRWSAPNH